MTHYNQSGSFVILSPELAARLIRAERDCYVDWVRAMDADYQTAVQDFGSATAIVCARVHAEIWNRVFHFTPADYDRLPEIIDFYESRGVGVLLDLTPYTVPAYWTEPLLYRLAANYGMFHAVSAQMLYGTPTLDIPPVPEHITIKEVDADNRADFERVYEQVWGSGRDIVVLAGKPNFRCYLAYVEGQPAALGVVHIANGAASMANGLTVPALRGKGCQTALLYHRIRQAALEGCDLLVSQCAPGSQSQHNQLKVGFQIAGTKTWWMRLKDIHIEA